MEHCRRLSEKGAGLTVSENLEASIALAQDALVTAGENREDIDEAVERFRSNYYRFAAINLHSVPPGKEEEP
jgi:hypothetical protein